MSQVLLSASKIRFGVNNKRVIVPYSFPNLHHSKLIDTLLFRLKSFCPYKGRVILSFSISHEKVASRSGKYGSAKTSYLAYFSQIVISILP